MRIVKRIVEPAPSCVAAATTTPGRRRFPWRRVLSVRAVLALATGLGVSAPPALAQSRIFPDTPSFELPLASPRVTGLVGRIIDTKRADNLFGTEREADVGVGEDFPVIALRRGERPISVGFGVAAYGRFSLDDPRSSLISNDWTVGLNVNWMVDTTWSLVGQLYHESSHLGDEYAETFGATRIDWTREVSVAWAVWHRSRWKVMGGPSYALVEKPRLKRWGGSLGVDYRGSTFTFLGQPTRPIAGVFADGYQATDWKLGKDLKLGIAFPGAKQGRELTLAFIFHDGKSTQRQFYTRDSRYLGMEIGFQL